MHHMKKAFSLFSTISVLSFFALITPPSALAGGGQYHPMNFSWGQVVNGKSINLEVQIQKDDYSGFASGEDFEFVAHHDLSGADCSTSQRTADGNGVVKGTCKSDGTGRFVFDVQPITKQSVQGGSSFEIYFTNQASNNGFSDQTSKSVDQVTAVIVQSPSPATLGKAFSVEVKAQKNNQILDDTSLIQLVRWTVLKGSMVTLGSVEGAGNRKLNISVDDRSTIITADVTLKSGEQVKTASKTLKFALHPSPSPSPKTSPRATPNSSITPDQSATVSPSLSPGPPKATLPPEASAQQHESFLQKIWNWLTGWIRK